MIVISLAIAFEEWRKRQNYQAVLAPSCHGISGGATLYYMFMDDVVNGFVCRRTPTNGTATCNVIRKPCASAQRRKRPLLNAGATLLSSSVAFISGKNSWTTNEL